MFQEAYNRAPLSTERGCSPTQLWIRGMLGVAHSQRRVALEFNNPEVKWGSFIDRGNNKVNPFGFTCTSGLIS